MKNHNLQTISAFVSLFLIFLTTNFAVRAQSNPDFKFLIGPEDKTLFMGYCLNNELITVDTLFYDYKQYLLFQEEKYFVDYSKKTSRQKKRILNDFIPELKGIILPQSKLRIHMSVALLIDKEGIVKDVFLASLSADFRSQFDFHKKVYSIAENYFLNMQVLKVNKCKSRLRPKIIFIHLLWPLDKI
jgi:hypothetical protein